MLSLKLNGRRPWYLREASALAKTLGTSIADLVGEVDEAALTIAAIDPLEHAEFMLWKARRDAAMKTQNGPESSDTAQPGPSTSRAPRDSNPQPSDP